MALGISDTLRTSMADAIVTFAGTSALLRIYDGTQLLPTPFLDVSGLVTSGGERGLLGLAFHPNYTGNGYFFVNYTDSAGDTVVARYTVSANPNVADAGSAVIALRVDQPFANHNGGQLQFGPDGYLYVGTGDGGAANDPLGAGQRLDILLGKILRLDVDFNPGAYAIPADNPFVTNPAALDEIWAYGLRNPWRFSFDRLTGDLFIADVGQNLWEEVNFQPANSAGGLNYGWNIMEATHCFLAESCDTRRAVLPIFEYGHENGCSVTGGYMYRVKVPSLLNIYAQSGATGSLYWRGTSAFNNLVEQIDSGRPVLIGRSGHSVMVIGYKKTTPLFGPTAYQFLVHDPGDPNWSNQWKNWDWVINQTISFTTFAEVWIPSKPLDDRPLQTVGLPFTGATGIIRFTHRTEDGNVAFDGTLSIDENEPNWYGWKRTISSLKEIPGITDTLFMKLPLWNADRSNGADVSLRISVRKLDEGEVYSTHQFLSLPIATGPTYFTWSIPVDEMRTGKGEPDYRLKVELLKGGTKVLDQFDVDFRLGPPVPVIESVLPDPAKVGEEITITGKNFGDDEYEGEVSLGGNRLYDISEWSDTRIRLKLPTTARTGELVVTVGEGESDPYYLQVELAEDLLPKLNTSIVAIASFVGVHVSADGTGFDEIEISSGVTGTTIEWSGTSFTLNSDWQEPDNAGGKRLYTFKMTGTLAPKGDSIVTLSALYSVRWEAPDNAFVQIDTKELVFGGVPYGRSVISSDQRIETIIYELYGASVRSRLTKAVWKITDETGDIKFTYDDTDWENEFAQPGLRVAFGRENK